MIGKENKVLLASVGMFLWRYWIHAMQTGLFSFLLSFELHFYIAPKITSREWYQHTYKLLPSPPWNYLTTTTPYNSGAHFPQPLFPPLGCLEKVRIMTCAWSKTVGPWLFRDNGVLCSLWYDYGRRYGMANNSRFAGVLENIQNASIKPPSYALSFLKLFFVSNFIKL